MELELQGSSASLNLIPFNQARLSRGKNTIHSPSFAIRPTRLTGDVLIGYDSPRLISLLLVIKSCLVLFSFNDK